MRAKFFTLLVGIACMLALPNWSYAQCVAGEQEVIVNVTTSTSSFPAEIAWELVDDSDSSVLASAACGSAGDSSDTLCLPIGGSYTMNALDDWGDGWNGGSWEILIDGGVAASGVANDGAAGDGAAGCALLNLEESVGFTLTGCGAGEVPGQLVVTLSGFPDEVSWEFVNSTGDTLASLDCGTGVAGTTTVDLCLTDGETYTLNAFDDWGDGWNGGTYEIYENGVLVANGAPNNGVAGDGAAGCGGSDLEETVSFTVGGPIAGCTDPLALNYNPAATVDDSSCLYPSPNDECVDAIDIAMGSCVSGDLVNATFNAADSIDAGCAGLTAGAANDIWFTFTVPASGSVSVELPVVPGISSTLEFLIGGCGSLTSLGLPCSNYGAGGGVTITGLTPSDVIYVRYFDFGNNDEGAYEICVSEPVAGCTDPCSDNFDSTAVIDDGSCIYSSTPATCASATVATAGTQSFINSGAVADTVDVTSCTFNDFVATWFAYTVPVGLVNVDIYTCGSTHDTGLSLWTGCDTSATEIACNDDGTPGGGSACGGGTNQSYVQLDAATLAGLEGTTVYIRVAGYNGSSGCGDLIIDESMPCGTPVNLSHTIAVDGMSVTVCWDAVDGANGYRIKGRRAGGAFRYRNTSDTCLTVPIQLDKGPYEWQVKAGCDFDNSDFSAVDVINTVGPRIGTFQTAMFPNPADEQVQLSITAEAGEQVTYQIADMLGRVVADGQVDADGNVQTLVITTADFAPGTYLVTFKGTEGVNTQSLQIAH